MSGPTILVVDDNAVTRRLVTFALEAEGFPTLGAGTGKDALELARRHVPALVLQDLVLPDIDGFELVGRLRKVKGLRGAPILAFTGYVSDAEDHRIAAAGFDGLLVKPLLPSEVIAAVRDHLNNARTSKKRKTRNRSATTAHQDLAQRAALQTAALSVLATIAETLRRHRDIHSGLGEVLAQCVDAGGLSRGAMLLRAPDSWRCIAQVGFKDAEAATVACARALALHGRTNHSLSITPGTKEADVALRSLSASSVLIAPMLSGDDDLGVLVLTSASRILSGDEWRDFARAIASQLAQAINLSRAFEAIRASERRYRDLFESNPHPMWVIDNESLQFLAVNAAAILHYGYTREEFLSMTADMIRPEEEAERFRQSIRQPRHGVRLSSGWRHRKKDGTLIDIEVSTHDLEFIGRRATLALVTDVTERKRSEQLVRRLSTAVEQSPAAVIITDPDGHIEYVNQRFAEITGYTLEQVRGKTPRVLKSGLTPPATYEQLWATIKRGETWRGALRNRHRSGQLYWQQISISPIRDGTGAIAHFVAVQEDFTARREVEERLRGLFDGVPIGLYRSDRSGALIEANPAFVAMMGYPDRDSLRPVNSRDLYCDPGDRERLMELLRRSGTVRGFATRLKRRDGSNVPVEISATGVRDIAGHITLIDGSVLDVTERQSLLAQLIQAQKMEAVGLLAGGIAHDFNNLLGAITVFGELAASDLANEDPRREDLNNIQEAVRRAATLTRQLLAFTRQQVLNPRVLDLNEVITNLLKILSRMIGEDITLTTELGAATVRVRADASQIEQVLMNLAVNARDAMPKGGQLTIATNRAVLDEPAARAFGLDHAGEYLVLRVADTGSGMTDEVRRRIFEPFFSTKGAKGTGLGLATVHGIVKQSGGAIAVESEPGRGTTFTIYLPATAGGPGPDEQRHDHAPSRGGSETILLVEDDRAVRLAANTVLSRLGYHVLVCRSGEEALAMAAAHADVIHLVLSDVVMPGIDGRELVERLRTKRPNLRALLTSGYVGDTITRRGISESGLPLLEKPFTSAKLAAVVREVLDAEA